MNWINHHEWPDTDRDAYIMQRERAPIVNLVENAGEPGLIAACEAAYGFGGRRLYAAALVLTFPELREIERSLFEIPVTFPYIPGLFYFREGPALVGALTRLRNEPDLLIISGHGIAHPQRCGLACHIGIDFDKPTIGCARRLLCGEYEPVAATQGSSQPLTDGSAEVGLVYRSRGDVKPIFVSPGHKCDVPFSRDIIVHCLRGFRLPEPLRQAHRLANKHKRLSEKDDRQKTKPA